MNLDSSTINALPSTSEVGSVVSQNVDHKGLWVESNEDPNAPVKFICLWAQCDDRFGSIYELELHLEDHCNEYKTTFFEASYHVCQVRGCGVESENIDELNRHLKMHIFHVHKLNCGLIAVNSRFPNALTCSFPASPRILYQGEPLTCEWENCTEHFDDINLYFNHINAHIDFLDEDNLSENGFQCKWGSDCKLAYPNKCNLRSHVRHHSGDKYCACPFCGSFFANNTKLFDHINRRQNGDFVCFLCQKRFNTARLLKAHCRRHVRNFKCAFCPMALESASAVKRHVALVHAKIKTHVCPVCSKSFGQTSDLAKHMAIHNDTPEFSCPSCDEKFKWRKQLNIHIRKHDDNYREAPYLCHFCGNTYKTGSTLSRHFVDVHLMKTPIGFTRFQYKKCADGFYRLQTRRCLSKELASEIGVIPDNEGDIVLGI